MQIVPPGNTATLWSKPFVNVQTNLDHNALCHKKRLLLTISCKQTKQCAMYISKRGRFSTRTFNLSLNELSTKKLNASLHLLLLS
jgi:hypothetical protein